MLAFTLHRCRQHFLQRRGHLRVPAHSQVCNPPTRHRIPSALLHWAHFSSHLRTKRQPVLQAKPTGLTSRYFSTSYTRATDSSFDHVLDSSIEQASTSRVVGYWLLGCSALVFSIVIVGGVTRLTESGLSITEWKPITGIWLPSSPEKWMLEYKKYRSSPEFKLFVKQ
jgi:hypothetical protein